MLRLSGRLKEIVEAIDADVNVLADVGCDHGKLICFALVSHKAKRGFAIDISESSLKKAIKLATDVGISDKISFLHEDGLKDVSEPIDVAVIAGLGGNEIVKIIDEANCFVRSYLLCPHQDAHIVRKYLSKKRYGVKKDFIIEDNGKFYPILYVEKNYPNLYKSGEYYIGKNLPKTRAFSLKNEKRMAYLQTLNVQSETLSEEIQEETEELSLWKKSST